MKANYRHQVELRIENRPHLKPIFSHVFDIPKRVYEYDNSFFVVFNTRNQRYEVHSLDYPGEDTISVTVPYKNLDERTLRHIYRNDIRVHGMEIFRRLELAEEKEEKRKERETKNFTEDFAREHQSAFAKDAWG
jgi:hypothetical protein